jgi:hypothetical protein
MRATAADLPDLLPDAQWNQLDTAGGAAWLSAQGARIASRRGVVWARRTAQFGGSPGFWTPVAELTPVPAERLDWPSRRALGYRAAVLDPAAATGRFAIWLIKDLPGYGASRVGKDRRTKVRRSARQVEYRVLTDPEPLLAYGWPVAVAAAERSGQSLAPDEETFRRWLEARFAAHPQGVLAAYLDGRLAAFALTHAIAGTAFLSHVYVHPGARSSPVGSGLYWGFISLWRRAPGVGELSLGADLSYLPGLRAFKRSFGAELVQLPVATVFRRPVDTVLRRARPETYARSGAAGLAAPASA